MNDDLHDIIRAAHEPLTRNLPSADSPEALAIKARAMGVERPSRRRAVRPRFAFAALALLLLAAAATWLILRDVERHTLVCLAEVEADADRAGVVPDGVPSPDDCAPAWRDGALTNPAVAPGEVPPLVGCSDGGTLVVIPAEDASACFLLDLEPAAPIDPESELHDLAAVKDELGHYIASEDCADLDATTAEAERILAESDLDGWTVERMYGPPEYPCASLSFDEDDRTIYIVPIDPPPPGG